MKYLEYASILLFTIFRKVFGLVWIYVALPFRHYANNVVFNYVLANGVYLQRLNERMLTRVVGGWNINSAHCPTMGYIVERKVSYLEYKLVYWLIWGWLDADCNDDTFDYGHVERLTKEGGFLGLLVKGATRKQYGNSFDLGDARESNFHFGATTQWNFRNTAYNFRYMQYEKSPTDKNLFLITIGSWKFGWVKDEDKDNYSLAFGGV